MVREGCNLDKDEAEILKPSASSASSSTPPPPPQSSQPSLFMKPPSQDLPIQRADIQIGTRKPEADLRVEVRIPAESPLASAGCKRKKEGQECPPPVRPSNRCTTCQKKVGLIGFRCRCGELFCPQHRYSDAHGCSYDYKAAGREEISKNNPVVRAAKIIKI